jgi:aspartyl-tRNA(Asn)/glutamyl-tRNA(Gln) amidotransferase subunit C
MAISPEEVRYIAHLARLGLTQEQVAHFQGQLESILGYIDKLRGIDVTGVSPTAHVLDLRNITRPDEVRPSLDPEKILKIAPSREKGFFKVPKVIE